jgi:transposase
LFLVRNWCGILGRAKSAGATKQVLDNVASLFARGASALGDGEEEHERETAKLYTKIGQLTVETDFLARRPGR